MVNSLVALERERRDGRVAEGARLESVFTRKGNQGSNPCLSAMFLNVKRPGGSFYSLGSPGVGDPVLFGKRFSHLEDPDFIGRWAFG